VLETRQSGKKFSYLEKICAIALTNPVTKMILQDKYFITIGAYEDKSIAFLKDHRYFFIPKNIIFFFTVFFVPGTQQNPPLPSCFA